MYCTSIVPSGLGTIRLSAVRACVASWAVRLSKELSMPIFKVRLLGIQRMRSCNSKPGCSCNFCCVFCATVIILPCPINPWRDSSLTNPRSPPLLSKTLKTPSFSKASSVCESSPPNHYVNWLPWT